MVKEQLICLSLFYLLGVIYAIFIIMMGSKIQKKQQEQELDIKDIKNNLGIH